jgi:hypothetical protein
VIKYRALKHLLLNRNICDVITSNLHAFVSIVSQCGKFRKSDIGVSPMNIAQVPRAFQVPPRSRHRFPRQFLSQRVILTDVHILPFPIHSLHFPSPFEMILFRSRISIPVCFSKSLFNVSCLLLSFVGNFLTTKLPELLPILTCVTISPRYL